VVRNIGVPRDRANDVTGQIQTEVAEIEEFSKNVGVGIKTRMRFGNAAFPTRQPRFSYV
jgi:hypothetical protein